MYEYLEGMLQQTTEESIAVIDVGGIGFKLLIPKSSSYALSQIGQKVLFWVSLVIREDSHTLYGFITKQERELFNILQQVSGIGPKVALNILGKSSLEELAKAIFRKDVSFLSSIPGVGKKLAERLSLELQDKVGNLITTKTGTTHTSLSQNSIQALQTLGFSLKEAREAIVAATQASPTLTTIEELIQYALTTRK